MEVVIFLLFFLVFLILMVGGRYYFLLFTENREEYSRYELFSFQGILAGQWHAIFTGPESYLAFVIFSAFTYLWTWLGGMIGSPHYTNEPGNYIFHSFLLLLLILVFRKNTAELVMDKTGDSFFARLLASDKAIVLATGITTIAATIAIYGYYHEIFFIFVLINLFFTGFFCLLGMTDSFPLKMQYPFIHAESYDDSMDDFSQEIDDIDIDDEFQ